MPDQSSAIRLFEVNLISDRVHILLRRRALEQWCAVGSLAMLAGVAVLALFIVSHMTKAFHLRSAVKSDRAQLEAQLRSCRELDELKAVAMSRIAPVAPLLPLARCRMAWAPKLVAVAGALPPGTGLDSVHASFGDLFAAPAPARAPNAAHDEAGLPQMFIAILYSPSAGTEVNPIVFLEHLRDSQMFMKKLDFVRLEATEQDTWQGRPIVILRSFARGAVSQ